MVQTVCVVGLGYIGLPTAGILANRGFDVVGMDVSLEVVETINKGEIHIVEPDLDTFIKAAVNSRKLKAFTEVLPADVFMIAVPTPFNEGHVPNIDYVMASVEAIAPVLKKGNLVILESTSPVGTTKKIADRFAVLRPDICDQIFVAHCPERVLPGKIMQELIDNDRVVGGIDESSSEKARKFYKMFVKGQVLVTDADTAEMCKLVENAYRDVNIAFANELSMICDNLNIDVRNLIRMANHHPRVNILSPGTGVGGHCIAVDPYFIIHSDPENAKMIRTARETNNYKTDWVIVKIKEAILDFIAENDRTPVVGMFGLAFKPDVDDLRESPALQVAVAMQDYKSCEILTVEPNIDTHDRFVLIEAENALKRSDIAVLLVAHSDFQELSYEGVQTLDFAGVIAEQ